MTASSGDYSVATSEQDRNRHHGRDGDPCKGPRNERLGRTERVAEAVGGKGVEGGPQDSSRGVIHEEFSPRHPSGTTQKGRVGAKNGDEPAEEDDFRSVTIEEVSTHFEFRFVESHEVTVAADQSVTADSAEHVADVVAHDGRGRGDDEENPNREVMGLTGVESRGHQDRLTG